MKLSDVRRLSGPSLFFATTGAAAEATLPYESAGHVAALWRREAASLLKAVGWEKETTATRCHETGASLAVSAPADCLFAATDLVELAWARVQSRLAKEDLQDPQEAVKGLLEAIEQERDDLVLTLREAATQRGLACLEGEGKFTLGLGCQSQSWDAKALPKLDDIDWSALGNRPVAMVTGTNGKSTTVRMTAEIMAAAGKTAGLSSSDWVRVGKELVDEGDYSGPAGARLALRDPRMEMAVLEVARGGLMRRGLTVTDVQACAITNLAADHLGQYGINNLEALAEAKFLVTQALGPDGWLVPNADDPLLAAKGAATRAAGEGRLIWTSMRPDDSGLRPWIKSGAPATYLQDDGLVFWDGEAEQKVIAVDAIPATLGGAARFNIANALMALALSWAMGLPLEAAARGLAAFQQGGDSNPGRLDIKKIGGVSLVIDFAHNPHGVAALVEAVGHIAPGRRLFLLGQAGDRRDEDIDDLTEVIWRSNPAKIIVKELAKALRGRELGEVPALISQQLEARGAPSGMVQQAESEIEAVKDSLAWAQADDLLILLIHKERKQVLAYLQALQESGWQAGDPLPAI